MPRGPVAARSSAWRRRTFASADRCRGPLALTSHAISCPNLGRKLPYPFSTFRTSTVHCTNTPWTTMGCLFPSVMPHTSRRPTLTMSTILSQ